MRFSLSSGIRLFWLIFFVAGQALLAQTFDPKSIPGLQIWVHTGTGVVGFE